MTEPVNRAAGIGASEVAVIGGVSPWQTPAGLWLTKVGLSGGQESTGPMRMGLALERSLVRLLAEEADIRLTHNRQTFRHPDWPDVPMYATPDAFGPHRWALAEIKVVGPGRYEDWRTGPPEYVRLQAQAQMACLPRSFRVLVGALVGSELRTYTVERDPKVAEAIVEGVVDWWRRYVVPEVAPPPEGPDDTWALLRASMTPEDARPERVAIDEEEVAARRLLAALEAKDEVEAEIAALRLQLAQAAESADLAGVGWRGRWTERRTTDWPALARELRLPKRVVESYTRQTPMFTFRRAKAEPEEEPEEATV